MNQDQYTVSDLFGGTNCISKEILLKYVEGKLERQILRKVEVHLIDCPLCADAVEGIEMTGTAAFEQMLKNVDDRIDSQGNETEDAEENDNVIEFRPQINPPAATTKNPSRYFKMFGIAASILLLAVVGFFFLGGESAGDIADMHFKEVPAGAVRSSSDEEKTTFDMADNLYLAKDYAGAAALYDKINVPSAIFQAGNCYYQLAKYDLAAARYQTVIGLQKSWVEYAEFNLAMADLKLDKVADAKNLLTSIAANEGHNFNKQAKEALKDVQDL